MLQRNIKTGRYLLRPGSLPSEGDRECPICRKVFHYKRAGCNKLPVTCSKECRYKYIAKKEFRQIPRVCANCKKVFMVFPCWIKKDRGNDGTYCSLKCRWKGKINYSDKQKNKARNKVRIALKQGILIKGKCAVCGDSNTKAHHYKGYSDKNILKVIWLCPKHHVQEHERLRRLGLLDLL